MKVKSKEYEFDIFPFYGKVKAEIYQVSAFIDGEKMNIRLISKEFGSFFRTPNENDYKKARKWVDLQIKCIYDSNI